MLVPLATGQRRRWSWYGLDTLHGSCSWAVFPCQNQCRHPVSEPAGTPEDSRSSPSLCGRRRAQSRPAQHPPCSGPWPSCCPLRCDQTRSCLVWRSDRTHRPSPRPSFQVPSPAEWRVERTCHLPCTEEWYTSTTGSKVLQRQEETEENSRNLSMQLHRRQLTGEYGWIKRKKPS